MIHDIINHFALQSHLMILDHFVCEYYMHRSDIVYRTTFVIVQFEFNRRNAVIYRTKMGIDRQFSSSNRIEQFSTIN